MKLTTVLMTNSEGLTTGQGILCAAVIAGIFVFGFFSPKIFRIVNRKTGHESAQVKQ